jgi:diadenosine tetraphosphate (Ap4A) HIT family hydrolase
MRLPHRRSRLRTMDAGKLSPSPFVNPGEQDQILRNYLCYARWDKFPVSKGHLLVIPYRQFASYFDATEAEKRALWSLVDEAKLHLDKLYHPAGYNIGINVGKTSGQTVMHMHIHVIPRYTHDMCDPEGGVRGVIPEKRKYR